ncbi:NitT/TauT family transport system substrate-binding protein [Nakamurella panacisegetis]|uniref:NitT/TauT family transport system substrate-binding protein n=1 Tax=Nakamurella panacisegetis TaxID=1090615 RepID=A0A1H0IDK9_9ACTN|nr:ABC transporter substrate-binding protein [Nakamurella panacisegetis]SDO29161.1 NitT/TauT family transport system substrate-binding protein [Nakamurella panacisegetis]
MSRISISHRTRHRFLTAPLLAGLVVLATACGSSSASTPSSSGATGTPTGAAGTLRLGYFANVTHAAAVLGVADGSFTKALGSTKLETQVFNAGPAAIEALNADAIDAAFLGPSPAINSYVKSGGDSLRIVAGATDNGASLVVKPGINSAADLKGKTIATPQLGGTQDVSLREYLFKAGLKVQTNGGSDVDVVNQDNAQTLGLFRTGQVDGAWLPEPWASRLVEAGGKTLVDESTLWPNKEFPTTILVVGKKFLDEHPDTVRALISGEITAAGEIAADPAKSSAAINDAIGKLTGKKLSDSVMASAFKNIKVTVDPLAATYNVSSQHAVDGGLLKSVPDINGLFDLRILNKLLKASGKSPVSADGLGQE